MHKKNLLIFTDPGLDDAIALLWLIKQKQLNILGIVPVAGNHNVDQVEQNAKNILGSLELEDIPIFSTKKFAQNYYVSPAIHGEDGLGDFFNCNYCIDSKDFYDTNNIINNIEYEILSLAPCTLLAEFLRLSKNKPTRITIMGGINKIQGNFNGNNEFNFGIDLNSAQYIFSNAGVSLYVVPLDVTRQYCFSNEFLKSDAPNNRKSSLFYEICNRHIYLTKQRGKFEVSPHDLIAAISIIYSNIFSWEKCNLNLYNSNLKISEGIKDLLATNVVCDANYMEKIILNEI